METREQVVFRDDSANLKLAGLLAAAEIVINPTVCRSTEHDTVIQKTSTVAHYWFLSPTYIANMNPLKKAVAREAQYLTGKQRNSYYGGP